MAKPSYATLMQKALSAGNERKYAEAEDYLTRIIAETDNVPEAWLFLGRARHAGGDPMRAVAAFRAFLSKAPDSPAGWFYIGRSYLSLGLARAAHRSFQQALSSGANHAELWTLMGLCELKLKRSAKALSCLEHALTLKPEDPRVFKAYVNALYVHALRLLSRGEADMARQMLSFVIDNGADGAAARVHRSRAFRLQGQLAAAVQDLREAMDMSPEDSSIPLQAAALYFALGRPDEALRMINQAGAELPGPADAPWTEDILERWRAALALAQGYPRSALDAALARIKKGDKDAALRAIAAQANYELKRYDRAANHYRLACEADPASPDFRMGLSLSLWELGDIEGARAGAKAAAARGADPGDSDYITLLCDAKAGARPEELLPRVQELLMARPADPRLMFILAESQYKLGMPELAERWLDHVVELQADNELALLYRIAAAESLGDTEAAIERYAVYMAKYPDNNKIRREYAALLMDSTRWNDAATLIEGGYAYGSAGRTADAALALCYRNAARYRDAAARYRMLLKEEPKNVEYLLGLAFSLDKSGARALAVELLERGAAYIKKEAEPYLVLGVLRIRAKEAEKAAEAFMKASELAPADPRPLRNLARLYEQGGVPDLAARFRQSAERLEKPRKGC
jgi:tetratricopeptide (TPR) repeat protein